MAFTDHTMHLITDSSDDTCILVHSAFESGTQVHTLNSRDYKVQHNDYRPDRLLLVALKSNAWDASKIHSHALYIST